MTTQELIEELEKRVKERGTPFISLGKSWLLDIVSRLKQAERLADGLKYEDFIICDYCSGGGADGQKSCLRCNGSGVTLGNKLTQALGDWNK